MKIPTTMTEAEVLATMTRVVDRIAHKYRFGYFDIEDIKQEAFIIAMEAMERYDEARPLENFLAVHVSNRLKNFKRDNFFRPDYVPPSGKVVNDNETKRFLMEPLDIDNIRDEHERNMRGDDNIVEELAKRELMGIVDTYLDMSLRSDYLRILHGVYVPKPRREHIYQAIMQILREHKEG
jgi:DNA-directed RNA polymerase specialized sigma24 family protein|tara:strand:- start:14849 stop:15388 length:540 start_codon:yes stop_codon:yes gene_type:complete